jgi:ribosomal protein S18 acetylase RimI-like enzyme
MQTDLTLRVAEARDMARLLEMMADFNAGERIVVDPVAVRVALGRLLDDPSLGRVWLVSVAGELVGYTVLTFGFDLEFAGRDAFITELYLLPSARGRGIGRDTMAAIEAAAAALDVKAIHLGVLPENTAARALYRRAGFEPPPRILLSKVLKK